MYNFNLMMVNHSLVKAIKIMAACKRMVGVKAECYEDLVDIDREVREAAAECQRVLALVKLDEHRPLCDGF